MSDTMKTELLQPGQDPAGLPEGQRPAELPFLGSGSEAGRAAEERLKAGGVEFVEGTDEVEEFN